MKPYTDDKTLMTPDEIRAYHKSAVDKYLATIAEDPDWLDDLDARIMNEIYYSKTGVVVVMDSNEWDAVLSLMRLGRLHLPKPRDA